MYSLLSRGHFCPDSVPLQALHSVLVQRPITERIKKLRQEIAELTEKNRKYSLGPKYGSAAADNERRFQRLIEIRPFASPSPCPLIRFRQWYSSPCCETVCLDKRGRPQFRDLLFHRGGRFYAFDLLMYDGKDIRSERLTDRKHELRRLLSGLPTSRLRYADHVERNGTALFQRVCEMDLEGIVAKHSLPYTTDTTWFKIKNRNYSQMQGREELFERERHKESVAGWHSCELACAKVEQ
jgi:ATP dependent DNA ligase domain